VGQCTAAQVHEQATNSKLIVDAKIAKALELTMPLAEFLHDQGEDGVLQFLAANRLGDFWVLLGSRLALPLVLGLRIVEIAAQLADALAGAGRLVGSSLEVFWILQLTI
jgi:hypothetical protein